MRRRPPARGGAGGGSWPDGRAGAGAVAERTALAAQLGVGWVWPHWLERQLDPASPAYVPLADPASLTNVTARSWTTIGNVGSAARATVDPRGLVTPTPGGWSLDWWVGAEDRWHLPSREPAVRQRLVDDAPVVATAMRVPGGDIIHSAYAIRSAPADGARELVVVEIENATPVPVALALAVRPCNPEGVATVERIGLLGPSAASPLGSDPWAVLVDGRPALLLPKAPNRVASSTFAEGDVAGVVLGGDAGAALPAGDHRCEVGLASAAVIYPLPHRARLTVVLPLDRAERPRRRRRVAPAATAPAFPAAVPSAAQVANGWKAHAGRGLRLVLPDVRLAAAVEASRRSLLAFHGEGRGGAGPSADPGVDVREVATVLGALDRFGYRDEVAEGLLAALDRQTGDGDVAAAAGTQDATGAALHAIGEHWRLHRDQEALEGMGPVVAAAAEWIERRRRAERGSSATPEVDGLLPPGPSLDQPGPPDVHYGDALWSVRGLLDAADVLEAVGELDAASETQVRAKRFGADLDASLAAVAARLGSEAMPSGPRRPVDARAASSLAACWPLRLFGPDDPRILATAEAVRERWCHGPAVVHRAGLDPVATLRLAAVELAVGDRRGLDRLDWLLSVAGPTWAWPQVLHPRLEAGSAGAGHSGPVAAALLSLVRDLLVRETPDGLALCSTVPDHWLGQQLEVHDAPTHHGTMSFALRWHGDRPALLWELEPHDPGAAPVRITVPGLDPGWSTTERRGDALLAAVAPAAAPEVEAAADVPGPAGPDPSDLPVTPVQLSPRRRRER